MAWEEQLENHWVGSLGLNQKEDHLISQFVYKQKGLFYEANYRLGNHDQSTTYPDF